jgi:starch synthase (maltosyl-transferring)
MALFYHSWRVEPGNSTFPDPSQPLRRVVIEGASPEIDGGRFAVKRIIGDVVTVETDVFADGHDELDCRLEYLPPGAVDWCETPMALLVNDRWQGEFTVEAIGDYRYRIEAWVDRFATWRRDLAKRIEAGQDVGVELQAGALLVSAAAARAAGQDGEALASVAAALDAGDSSRAFDTHLSQLMRQYPDRRSATCYDRCQRIAVDRERAGFSAWYEMFPRSASPEPSRHGTFKDVIARLPYVAGMGFDILYLPPIHPIGRTNRKGKNNAPLGDPGDIGSPWAIGAVEGGHKAVHPELGTLDEFAELVAAAREHGLEVALDIAFQVAPDHPYVSAHPEWFLRRPDGSIRYAENPPKRYEDIYPINFETEDSAGLWSELETVFRFWMARGVRIFRVDNPHTKAFAFWEWVIQRIRKTDPDVIFLSEAFTRPKPRYYLAKLGFTQSYTYFAWRTSKWELTQYLTELMQTAVKDYFRPNFWPNTPDILHDYLQTGGRPAFYARLVLAATLGSNYGIYGPAFELCVSRPREEGSEEYLDSEKYELKYWDIDAEHSLRDVITRVNRARRANPALQRNDTLRFLDIDNDYLLAYLKTSADGRNAVIVVVNLDPHNGRQGMLRVPLADLGIHGGEPYQVYDCLSDKAYTWQGEYNYIDLSPAVASAHILVLTRPGDPAPTPG